MGFGEDVAFLLSVSGFDAANHFFCFFMISPNPEARIPALKNQPESLL